MIAKLDKTSFDIEDFGDEVVLVQIQTGVYYTIKGTGPVILRAFEQAADTEETAKAIPENTTSELLKEVQEFIARLVSEGIIVETDLAENITPALLDIRETPIFEKFDDISDLVKLDPIHDVSDLGWPHKK